MGRALRAALERLEREQGTIVLKTVYCKHCRPRCRGHGPYRYRVRRWRGKLRWEYLGKAAGEGGCQVTRPEHPLAKRTERPR